MASVLGAEVLGICLRNLHLHINILEMNGEVKAEGE